MNKKKKAKPARKSMVRNEVKSGKTFLYVLFTMAAFILYSDSIPNDYAYDDGIVITNNEFTMKGISGIVDIFRHDSFYGEPTLRDSKLVAGGRYRPLSIATFALEKEFFGKNPHVSHFINVLILLFTVFLIYKISSKYLFPNNSEKWYFSVPFIAAVLFLFHPVHTETVANIKGRDDMLCLYFSIVAALCAFRYFSTGKIIQLIGVFVFLFLALLSKEIAITFVAAIPLMIYFFEKNTHVKKYLLLALSLFSAAILYMVIRTLITSGINDNIVPNLMNNSFLEATTAQKYATIVFTLGLYLKLLFVPHPLTYDYYPYHIGLENWTSVGVIISILIWTGLLIVAILYFRKKSVVSFSILFFVITMSVVSNLFFPIGVFMSERFLYMPSLAFCLLIAYLIVIKLPGIMGKFKKYIMPVFLVVLILFSYKTISRNRVWESSQRLYATDVITSSRSAKSNYDYAVSLAIQAEKNNNAAIKTDLYEKSLVYLRKALSIYPRFTAALVSYADISFKYRLNADTAILYYEKARMIDSTIKTINNSLGTLYGQYKGDYDRAIQFFNIDVKNNRATVDTYKKLAMCYFFKKDSVHALIFADKGLQLEPDNPELMQIHNLSGKTSSQ